MGGEGVLLLMWETMQWGGEGVLLLLMWETMPLGRRVFYCC